MSIATDRDTDHDTGGAVSRRHTEAAFEAAIETYLTKSGGYVVGEREAFDAERCLDRGTFLAFVQETQPDEWAYLQDLQKDKAAQTLIDDLCRALDSEHQRLPLGPASRLQVLRQAISRRPAE